MHLFCDAWSRSFNLFERFENQGVQSNQKEVELVYYIKAYTKRVLKTILPI